MIATDQQSNQRVGAAFGGFHQQGFDRFFDRQIELLNQLGDGFRIWCINQLHLFGCRSTWCFWRQRFCKLNVRGVIRGVREDHIVFTALCQYLELMGCATADRTGISLNGAEIQTHAGEDFAVRFVHLVIGLLQRFLRSMERVSIFHQEFARAHDAKTWTHFITEFGLDLEEVQRQLLV